MTEKTIKNLKNKNKQLKIKKLNVQQKAAESDSDISEPDVGGKAPKMDQKALKMISSEVTDLLASLKKEHGIEDESEVTLPIKKDSKKLDKINKNKKEAKHVQDTAPVDAKKTKMGQQPEKKLPAQQDKPKMKENKKQKLAKINADAIKMETDASIPAQQQENSPKKKKNKKQKRAAEDGEVDDSESPAKKVKPNQNQNQNQNQNKKQKPKPEGKKNKASNDATEKDSDEAQVKNEHHLKNATPVFVGNLPVNIKRLKLVKLFKKFGKILSIRLRTNKGKSFYKKTQIEKVPHLIAFIYFDTKEAAEASLVRNGEKIGENVIAVDLDRKDKSEVIKPQNTIVIGNLKYAVTDNILREAFKCCGEIEHIRTVQTTKGCSGVAFIRFAKSESCGLALKLNGTEILDREIRVERYQQNKAEKKVKKEKTPKPQHLAKNKKNVNKGAGAGDGKKSTAAKDGDKKKKNKEFMGTKSNDQKKGVNKKKKNKMSNEKRLAQKVAPKAEKASA